jgi:Peptide-N-glycosidase F, C terminal/Secretion system C-terminal sorting domain
MKKFLVLFSLVLASGFNLFAAAGDTTWVQANDVQLSWYNNYDTVVVFPHASGVTYRKVLMIFTLGKYVCPSGSTWCGDWDYTVLNYLMTPSGDTFEMARLITPYANASAPRTGWDWKQHYVFDVTDYANKLHDTATMRILYSGYSGGFTANIKFAFIEGTPDRNVLAVNRLWHGSFDYGDTSHADSFNINNHFTSVAQIAPIGTQAAALKFLVTGHGSDSNNCNEFCSHNYQVLLNSSSVATNTIWRDNCGANELYPQSGTWLYQRANWCPGAMVFPQYTMLPGIMSGAHYNLSLLFDPYVRRGSGPIYTTEAAMIYYGAMNKTLDVSVEDIICPNLDENHYRENPIAGKPLIQVKNTGNTVIHTLQISYFSDNMMPSDFHTFTWTGTLTSLQSAEIELPQPAELINYAGDTMLHHFNVKIVAVNGVADDDSTNNHLSSAYRSAPIWPSKFRMVFCTNNEGIPSDPLICETNWFIFDASGAIVAKRDSNIINTTYVDTISLPAGNYQLKVYDSSCDGLHWWVYDSNPSIGVSAGYIYATKMNGVTYTQMNTNIALTLSSTFHDDFGCGFTQYFKINVPTGIADITEGEAKIEAYPNPATNIINIDFSGMQDIDGNLMVVDALGKTVYTSACNSGHAQLNAKDFANGVYSIIYNGKTGTGNKLSTRILIVK